MWIKGPGQFGLQLLREEGRNNGDIEGSLNYGTISPYFGQSPSDQEES